MTIFFKYRGGDEFLFIIIEIEFSLAKQRPIKLLHAKSIFLVLESIKLMLCIERTPSLTNASS